MKFTITGKTLVLVLALVAIFVHAEGVQAQPLTNSCVLESDILTLIDPLNFPPGPPLNPPLLTFTSGLPLGSLVDLQGDPGVVQSAATQFDTTGPPSSCSDFPCGRGGNKVSLCHVPPGNPKNERTICISPDAADAHLANHEGDHCGPCE